ncbi:hypothetical protein VP01_2253g3 [Puccinia sorghi]|uniref:Uncharacterized protein n=1 Tax=Puccinia sorghi TaxID=27349 RepID=A0A0L6V8G4_9BASI|nr:hypothetical protein VP01_2253g3 [Puccinia sorghi]
MQQLPYSPSPLPDETLAFAERIFNGARAGDLPLEPLFSPPSPLLDVVCLLPQSRRACLLSSPTHLVSHLGCYYLYIASLDHQTIINDINFVLMCAGNNLLMLAAYHGKAELVRFLLSRGANPDRLNDRGQSAVSGAVFKGWTEVVKALLEAGADIRAGKPNAIDCAYLFVFFFCLLSKKKKPFRLLLPKTPIVIFYCSLNTPTYKV